jgi:hypothetical protein
MCTYKNLFIRDSPGQNQDFEFSYLFNFSASISRNMVEINIYIKSPIRNIQHKVIRSSFTAFLVEKTEADIEIVEKHYLDIFENCIQF